VYLIFSSVVAPRSGMFNSYENSAALPRSRAIFIHLMVGRRRMLSPLC
jgi:hypothetical protein